MEKIKAFFIKFGFVIEFIASIFAVYAFYKIRIFHAHAGVWPISYILMFIPTFLILVFTMYLQIKEHKEKIEKVFISFLIPISMLYVFYMIPTYAPDEHAHIWKAYEISTGKLMTPITEEGTANTKVPRYFVDNIVGHIANYGIVEEKKEVVTDYTDLVEVNNPAKSYPTILYLFSSIGFAFSRIFGINGMFAIYLARLLNLIVFLIAAYYSMKIIPFGKKIIGVILFLPMLLQQQASVSADSILNTISLLYLAFTLYVLHQEKKVSIKQLIVILLLSLGLAVSKITYVPLAGLVLLLISAKNLSSIHKKIWIPVIIISSCIMAVGWYGIMGQYPPADTAEKYAEENNVSVSEQIKNMIENPSVAKEVVENSLKTDAYVRQAIGESLGWLDIQVPSMYISCFFILLILAPFLDKNEKAFTKWQRCWMLLITVGTYLLVFLALYLTWTPVGLDKVLGVQGRYLLPILALPLLCLCKKDAYIPYKNINVILPILLGILDILVVREIYKFFI